MAHPPCTKPDVVLLHQGQAFTSRIMVEVSMYTVNFMMACDRKFGIHERNQAGSTTHVKCDML
jgi:hypothetical protein